MLQSELAICDIDPDLLEKIKKFKKRKAKNTAAIISGYKCAVEKI
jgi:hypothetical protein